MSAGTTGSGEDTAAARADIATVAAVPDRSREELRTVTRWLANGDIGAARAWVETELAQLGGATDEPAAKSRRHVLETVWDTVEGISLLARNDDPDAAAESLERSAAAFGAIGQSELGGLSHGLGMQARAISHFRRMDLGEGTRLSKEVLDHFAKLDRFGRTFQPIIDMTASDILSAQGMQAVSVGDYGLARGYIRKAAASAEAAAGRCWAPGTVGHSVGMGKARSFLALADYMTANLALQTFEFDRFESEDLTSNAKAATSILEQIENPSGQVEYLHHLTLFFWHMNQALEDLGRLLSQALRSAVRPTRKRTAGLLNRLQRAEQEANAAGPAASAFARSASLYSDQVKNLERYIQPKAKDFGLFSGLVACAVFVVLMAAVTIAGFKGTTALIISVMLALIAGFGFGALKFRDWLGDFLGGHGRAGSA